MQTGHENKIHPEKVMKLFSDPRKFHFSLHFGLGGNLHNFLLKPTDLGYVLTKLSWLGCLLTFLGGTWAQQCRDRPLCSIIHVLKSQAVKTGSQTSEQLVCGLTNPE